MFHVIYWVLYWNRQTEWLYGYGMVTSVSVVHLVIMWLTVSCGSCHCPASQESILPHITSWEKRKLQNLNDGFYWVYIVFFFNWHIIYSIVMTSAIYQQESAIGIHVSPPSWTVLPPHSPPHLSRLSQITSFGFPPSHIELPLAIYLTYGNICVSMLFSQIKSHPLLLPLCPKVFSLCLCRLCCPAHRLVSTIFLDPIYRHLYMIFVFLFLTYFSIHTEVTGSRFIHFIRTDSNVFLFIAK